MSSNKRKKGFYTLQESRNIMMSLGMARNSQKSQKNAIGIAQYSGESRRFPIIHEGIAQYL